jgi:hypothetical protein
METKTCARCGREIVWGMTTFHNMTPMELTENGTHYILDGRFVRRGDNVYDDMLSANEPTYQDHLPNCRENNEHG